MQSPLFVLYVGSGANRALILIWIRKQTQVFYAVLRIRLSFYADADPGSRIDGFRLQGFGSVLKLRPDRIQIKQKAGLGICSFQKNVPFFPFFTVPANKTGRSVSKIGK